jgi:hypothetical protein
LLLLLGFTCVALFIGLFSIQHELQSRSRIFLSLQKISSYISQKISVILITFLSITLLSCDQDKNSSVEQELPSNDSTVFYPIREYFTNQIKSVDSASSTIKMFTTINGQTDSSTINIPQFNKIAQTFLENDITDKSVKKYYKQSVFQDQTTQSITFNYTTVNSSLPVQSLDILLDTITQEVKRVFISRIKAVNDSTVVEKLNWKTNSSLLVNRSVQVSSNKEITQQISVVWGDNN